MTTATTSQLTDRYEAAVLRRVPESHRTQAAEQIHTDVAAAMDRMAADGVAPEHAERQALIQLGDPASLAVRFGGPPRYLIGPGRFDEYVRLLRLLAITVLPVVGVVMLILQAIAGLDPLDVLVSTLGVVVQVGLQLAFWVTLAFALMDRYESKPATSDWTPDDLPEVVERRITLADMALSITILSVLIWATLWQRDHWLITAADGSQVPALNPDLWSFWLPLVLAVLVASIVLEVVKYAVGHWTLGLAVVNTVLNVAFAVIVMWLWSGDRLLNPEVVAILPEGVPTLPAALPWVILIICTWDTVDGWWRTLRGGPVQATP